MTRDDFSRVLIGQFYRMDKKGRWRLLESLIQGAEGFRVPSPEFSHEDEMNAWITDVGESLFPETNGDTCVTCAYEEPPQAHQSGHAM